MCTQIMSALRLCQVLSSRSNGLWSRRGADKMVKAGRVAVNGAVVSDVSTRLAITDPSVAVDGIPLQPRGRARIWRAHKLRGELVTDDDPQGRPTMAQRFRIMGVTHARDVLERERRAVQSGGGIRSSREAPLMARLIPIGRLDYNSEGLMLFTSCPLLATRLESPADGVERTYAVKVRGQLSWPWLRSLRAGKTIDGVRYGPIEVSPLTGPPRAVRLRRGRRTRLPVHERRRMQRRGASGSGGGDGDAPTKQHWVKVTLSEGKNREIRKVMASMNLHVQQLSRTEFGSIALQGLPPGSVMELSPSRVRSVMRSLGMDPSDDDDGVAAQPTTTAATGV
jgi:23S rRNA pseudouridine2605 synthase